MTSGITWSGTDLDSIFAPQHSGWPVTGATHITVSGTDLNARYAALSTGTAASSTPITIAGTNLNAYFAAYGTTAVAISTQPSAVSGIAAAGNPSGSVTSNTTSCAAVHGNSAAYSYTWHIASGSATLTAPSSATCGVTATVNAGTTDTGSMYCTISDGVTSANTTTVGWSLQNTTPAAWDFTITCGQYTSGGDTDTGYSRGNFGTVTGGTLGALSVNTLMDVTSIADYASFSVDGFSSDPGQSWFTSIVANGSTMLASAATYGYGSGKANWSWNGTQFGFTNSSVTPCAVNF